MAKLGQSSFRRVLLSCILLLSVPVLLLGEVVTYRKARSSLLETARRNLTESAIRKGNDIQDAIKSAQANLVTASETSVLQSGSPSDAQQFLGQLQQRMATSAQCMQLTDAQTRQVVASTCGTQVQLLSTTVLDTQPTTTTPSGQNPSLLDRWSAQPQQKLSQPLVHITSAAEVDSLNPNDGQLQLVLSVPVYRNTGQLRYALSVQIALHQREGDRPGSLSGYTVVIDENGTILAHPSGNRIGRNIRQEPDAERLEDILQNAIVSRDADVRHLFGFQDNGTEWLAGFSPIEVVMADAQTHTWVVLAVTRIDNALYGLSGIKQILFILTLGLIAANLLATLYVARDLSRPLEQLGNYALQIQHRHRPGTPYSRANKPLPTPDLSPESTANSTELPLPLVVEADDLEMPEPAPRNFRIRELNQLAKALDSMVECLEERAEELETAWREAQAANSLKSEFLANTSHELRTPLNAIIGCIRLVRDGCCDDREEEIEFLQRADDAAIHLLQIINDLLDLAKIEAGTLSMSMQPVDLRDTLNEVMDLQTVPIQQKGLTLELPTLREPIAVYADPAKLRQVLLNVVSNAVKFTDEGHIAISARIESLTGSQNGHRGSRVILTVEDTGIGIDPAQLPKLFRPIVMADGTRTRRFEGTGLGLAISRNFIELMGGNITLDSAGPNQGTTVDIALPVIDASQLPITQSRHEANNGGSGKEVASSGGYRD